MDDCPLIMIVMLEVPKVMYEHRNASEQLTFDFEKIAVGRYLKITNAIVKKFNLKENSKLVYGFDEIFQDYKHENLIVGLEWDIWSGYIVVAQSTESESLAREIALFINKIFYQKNITKNSWWKLWA